MRNDVHGIIGKEKVLHEGQIKGHRNSEHRRYQRSIGKPESLVVESSTMV